MNERLDEPSADRNRLAEFFASREEAKAPGSSFIPTQVAEIVRRGRDASE